MVGCGSEVVLADRGTGEQIDVVGGSVGEPVRLDRTGPRQSEPVIAEPDGGTITLTTDGVR
jgi:hypothetical protein